MKPEFSACLSDLGDSFCEIDSQKVPGLNNEEEPTVNVVTPSLPTKPLCRPADRSEGPSGKAEYFI